MGFLLLGIFALAVLLLLAQYLQRANPADLLRSLRQAGGWACIAIGAILSIAGRPTFGLPLLAIGFGLLGRHLPFLGGGFSWPGTRSTGQASRVRTAMLEMTLDHDSGEMDGEVIAGRFEGRRLSALALEELLVLYEEAERVGDQSTALLEAFLDRYHADWRAGAGRAAGDGEARGRPSGGAMTREEAYEVLGLAPVASEADIRRAHKVLMKRFHPDQGGSDYLAAKINQAKDTLLGRR